MSGETFLTKSRVAHFFGMLMVLLLLLHTSGLEEQVLSTVRGGFK